MNSAISGSQGDEFVENERELVALTALSVVGIPVPDRDGASRRGHRPHRHHAAAGHLQHRRLPARTPARVPGGPPGQPDRARRRAGPDNGPAAAGTSQRIAFDTIISTFGPGYNGPCWYWPT